MATENHTFRKLLKHTLTPTCCDATDCFEMYGKPKWTLVSVYNVKIFILLPQVHLNIARQVTKLISHNDDINIVIVICIYKLNGLAICSRFDYVSFTIDTRT